MAWAVDTPTAMNGPVMAHPVDAVPFVCNVRSDDASGCETIKAAPGAGYTLVITRCYINSAAAITITLGEGNAGAAVTTAIMGPITFAANQTLQWVFENPIRLTSNTILSADASGAGVINIFVEGYTIAG